MSTLQQINWRLRDSATAQAFPEKNTASMPFEDGPNPDQHIEETEDKIKEKMNEKNVYDNIVQIFDKDGLIKYVMEKMILTQLQQQVNHILSFVTTFLLYV